jgi:C4-dicarboxylate-specific signal transduction histidine kinase
MQNGGRIEADVRACDRGIEVVVQDNGPGIAGDLRARIFEPFVSAGKRNGIGLGLALSRQTMRDHEGDLKVDFTSERGARFVVWLPPAAVKIAAAASEG